MGIEDSYKSHNTNLRKTRNQHQPPTIIKQQNKTQPWIFFFKDPLFRFLQTSQALFNYDLKKLNIKNKIPRRSNSQ